MKIDVAGAKVIGRWKFLRKNPGYESEAPTDLETFTALKNGSKVRLVIRGEDVVSREVTSLPGNEDTTGTSVKESALPTRASETKTTEETASTKPMVQDEETSEKPDVTTKMKWELFLWILPVIIIAIALARSRH